MKGEVKKHAFLLIIGIQKTVGGFLRGDGRKGRVRREGYFLCFFNGGDEERLQLVGCVASDTEAAEKDSESIRDVIRGCREQENPSDHSMDQAA